MRALPRLGAAAATALHFAAAACAHDLPPASTFVHPNSGAVRRRGTASRLQLQQQERRRTRQIEAVGDDAVESSSATATPSFHIREAAYADLTQAADLMTDGFYPNLQHNPILRPLRYLLELERLQGNFPYDDKQRHFYLAAYNAEGELVGFCDVDGRIPEANSGGFSLSPFATRVNRPQPYFSDLSIRPDHQRRGIASALMSEAEDRARKMGFEELYLGVRSANAAALQMYSNMGYELVIPSGDMVAFLEVQKDVRMLRRALGQTDR